MLAVMKTPGGNNASPWRVTKGDERPTVGEKCTQAELRITVPESRDVGKSCT